MNTLIFKAIPTTSNIFFIVYLLKNGKAFPVETWAKLESSRRLRLPVISTQTAHKNSKVVSPQHRLYCWLENRRNEVQLPAGLPESLQFQRVQIGSEVHPHSYSTDIRAHSCCGRAAGV
jgi:hypothetical protein